MDKNTHFSDFTNLYSISKTLRFELIPQGRTLEHIMSKGLIKEDENRANDYQEVKKLIDSYHKDFIEKSLQSVKLKFDSEDKKDSLSEYSVCYSKGKEKEKEDFEKIQSELRKQIVSAFSSEAVKERYKNLFTEKLIKEDLQNFTQKEEDRELIAKFGKFTTYFKGFHENRKNMYTDKEHSTGIAYRLINDNLPKFIDNIANFTKIKDFIDKDNIEDLNNNIKEYLKGLRIEDAFMLKNYSCFLTQSGIDTYNLILGGKSEEQGKVKVKGLNEYINLYNQNQRDKTQKLPKLKPLFKQILSDRNAVSWLPEAFEKDNQVLESIEAFYQDLIDNVICKNKEEEHNLIQLLQGLNDFDLSGIYLCNDSSLTDISQQMFGSWGVIKKALELQYEKDNARKPKETEEKYIGRKASYFKKQSSYSIGYINSCLTLMEDIEIDGNVRAKNISEYFTSLGKSEDSENILTKIEKSYDEIKELLNTDYPEEENLAQNKNVVEKIKAFLDNIKALQRFVKPLLGSGDEAEKDERFYGELIELYKQLNEVTNLYNKVRNYMTKKPYSEEKIKLNFQNHSLLGGWDVNKIANNAGVILRKKGLYYLAIIDKEYKDGFKHGSINQSTCFEKMEYKQIADAGKDIQNIILINGRYERKTIKLDELKSEYIPSIAAIKMKGSYLQDLPKAKEKRFCKNDLNEFINYYKEAAKNYWDWCCFDFKETSEYNNWKEFTDDVNQQGYKLTFKNISEENINKMVEDGKIYLFKIYNKDFSPHSKGTPNMHTLYWKMLFDAKNLQDVVYKLNGQAEVFYRKASIKKDIVVHNAQEPIANKNELNEKKESSFKYDIIKNKRYTLDKFQFHVPITMNFRGQGNNNIVPMVNQYLKDNTEKNYIIGIDRGERHLLYLTLINPKGEIEKQFSLNEIKNQYQENAYRTNYHQLLDQREGKREEARKNWQTIEGIKNLKEGYLSQVVHKIAELMVQYNAVVVIEDLNFGFIRGRQKIEKSVYQQFENKLITKLNYLVDKKKEATELGGTLKALQLTNNLNSSQNKSKQNGFLFYVPAQYTSKICPVTGFVNLFDTHYESVEKAKQFFDKFNSITYNSAKEWFEFEVKDYTKFSAKAEDTRINWTICTYSTRIEILRNPKKNNEWDSKEINLNEKFRELFKENNIDINDVSLKGSILKQTEKMFFERLLNLFKLTVQMRNSISNTDVDYMVSPVANKDGIFYDSRVYLKQENAQLPIDADANGAFNIARKGLWIINQIKEAEDLKKIKLAISNKEWLQMVQKGDML